jgi:hypothetical protein
MRRSHTARADPIHGDPVHRQFPLSPLRSSGTSVSRDSSRRPGRTSRAPARIGRCSPVAPDSKDRRPSLRRDDDRKSSRPGGKLLPQSTQGASLSSRTRANERPAMRVKLNSTHVAHLGVVSRVAAAALAPPWPSSAATVKLGHRLEHPAPRAAPRGVGTTDSHCLG